MPVASPDAADLRRRWPAFAAGAAEVGVVAVHTVPVRVGGRTIGTLNPFREREGFLRPVEVDVAHAMASFGAVGIGRRRRIAQDDRLREQLQEALDGRVVLEQAEGVLAERHRVHPDEAFRRLRAQARGERRRLHEVALEVVAQVGRVPAAQA